MYEILIFYLAYSNAQIAIRKGNRSSKEQKNMQESIDGKREMRSD
jgi:hypothetical protein